MHTPAKTQPEKEPGFREKWLAFAFLVVLVVCAGFVLLYTPDAAASTAQCEQARARGRAAETLPVDLGTSTPSTTLEVVNLKDTQIAMGRDPGPAWAYIGLRTDLKATAQANPSDIRMRVQSFRRGGNPEVRQAAVAYGEFSTPQTIIVSVCVERHADPTDANDGFTLDPGEYTGVLTITDPRLPTTTVPFTVDVAYPNVLRPLLLLFLVVFVGAPYLMVLRRPPVGADRTGGADQEVGIIDFHEFLRTAAGMAAVVAGTVACVGVYIATYVSSDTWGTATDWFNLLGVMFGTFVSTGTAFRFAANLSANPTPAKNGP